MGTRHGVLHRVRHLLICLSGLIRFSFRVSRDPVRLRAAHAAGLDLLAHHARLYNWLTVEDIKSELYYRKCGTCDRCAGCVLGVVRVSDVLCVWLDLEWEKEDTRRFGDPRTKCVAHLDCCKWCADACGCRGEKFRTGVIMFIGLIVLVWMPLLLFSGANPTAQANPVVTASLSLCTFEIISFACFTVSVLVIELAKASVSFLCSGEPLPQFLLVRADRQCDCHHA